jgi:hypothetical protein
MTQPTRSPTTGRVPMDAMRKTALVAGALYLVFKGFKASAPIIMAAGARSGGSDAFTAIAPRPVIATSGGPA